MCLFYDALTFAVIEGNRALSALTAPKVVAINGRLNTSTEVSRASSRSHATSKSKNPLLQSATNMVVDGVDRVCQ